MRDYNVNHECPAMPYLLDTQEKVDWANYVSQPPFRCAPHDDGKFRLGDTCPFHPVGDLADLVVCWMPGEQSAGWQPMNEGARIDGAIKFTPPTD